MEYVPFLNSSGAIVMPPNARISRGYAANLPIAPYIETVRLPVVSVDSSALYGEHPENLVTLTYSSGAALTFFCDSVAGGSDNSGDGSFEHPWRSMNTASRYLSCNACVLAQAAPYIQLKVKGTVDYISSMWQPFGYANSGYSKLIITGDTSGGRVDLGSGARVAAGHFFNVITLGDGVNSYDGAVFSNCAIQRGSIALDCDLGPYSAGWSVATIAAGCVITSADNPDSRAAVSATVCYGCTCNLPLITRYAYAPVVSVYTERDDFGAWNAVYGMYVSSAVVSADVTVDYFHYEIETGASAIVASAIGMVGGAYFGDCNVLVSANAAVNNSGAAHTGVVMMLHSYGAAAVSGGTWAAVASADAAGYLYSATAVASALGFGSADTLTSVTQNLSVSAWADFRGDTGSAWWLERIAYPGVSSAWRTSNVIYSNGA
ncbi:MAG: hypothetical protein J6Y54_09060, partial [Lentisphaeria bacterium]|nr:hypothetical protein [Lentisphaeria bacterium]